jgi:DNA repair exonuclease SbcCD ATPase subunit
MLKCDLFKNNLKLVGSPYTLTSRVPLKVFLQFILALEDNPIEVTKDNLSGVLELSHEFGFQSLTALLSNYRHSLEIQELRQQQSRFDERARQYENEIALLQSSLTRQTALHKQTAVALAASLARQTQMEEQLSQVAAQLSRVETNVCRQACEADTAVVCSMPVRRLPMTLQELIRRLSQLEAEFGRVESEFQAFRASSSAAQSESSDEH